MLAFSGLGLHMLMLIEVFAGETFNNLAYHKKATINRDRFPPKPVPFTVDGTTNRNPAFISNKGSFVWRVDLGNRCQISSVTLALMKMPKRAPAKFQITVYNNTYDIRARQGRRCSTATLHGPQWTGVCIESGRYVVLDVHHQVRLTLYEVLVMGNSFHNEISKSAGKYDNLALGKPVKMSTAFKINILKPALTVDGRDTMDSVYASGKCTWAATVFLDAEPWWFVDLGQMCQVHGLRIIHLFLYGKPYNTTVEVLSEDPGNPSQQGILCFYLEGDMTQEVEFDCLRPIIGRYVRLRKMKNTKLKSDCLGLCDVYVFGSPQTTGMTSPPQTQPQHETTLMRGNQNEDSEVNDPPTNLGPRCSCTDAARGRGVTSIRLCMTLCGL
ncbi:uncharacterized protein [Haliotis cracherodii]|uniref:uncharacterized protein n=1 Tax=Haliotis cracherodii TaxID=6455 RepID=UPI0039EC648A